MSKTCSSDLEKEVCELKAMVRSQNKQIELLIKHITDGCNEREEIEPVSTICNINPYLECLDGDILHHLSLSTKTTNFQKEFGDIRFVCMSGAAARVERLSHFIIKEVGLKMCTSVKLKDIAHDSHRFCMYKAGPVLCVNDGIGCPSVAVVLHEVIKLVHYAKCQNPVFFRLGTCGSIDVDPGDLIITSEALDGQMRPVYEVVVQGEPQQRPTYLSPQLIDEIQSVNRRHTDFDIVVGKTICTNDYYEGQSRMDGAFCGYTPEKKMSYLNKLKSNGVINMDMESNVFAALTYQAGIPAAIISVVIVNRMQCDQITASTSTLAEWAVRPQSFVAPYMRKVLYPSDNQPKCTCHSDV